jgi:glycosyltransferase involved in cell wall biosynthesis
MMKIAMYAPSWPPTLAASGIVTYLGQIVPALEGLGHQVTILTPQLVQKHSIAQRALFKLSIADALYWVLSDSLKRQIADLVAQERIDILEIEESFGLAHAVSRMDVVPVCIRLHGPWFLSGHFKDPRREVLEGRALRSAAAISSPSLNVLTKTNARYSRIARSTVAPNPITKPERSWSPTSEQSLLFVGRFDEIKGGDLAIRVFGRLATQFPKLRMTFVGPDEGVAGCNVHQYVSKELSGDALSRLSILGKKRPDEIVDLRMNHSISISCSRHEVMPYAVLEAMALGCPIVASNVGGLPEMIVPGHNGLLFRSGDIDDFTSHIKILLEHPDEAARMGAQARQDVANYDPTSLAHHTADWYREAIDRFRLRYSPARIF